MPTAPTQLSGHILTPSGFVRGSLQINQRRRIADISGEPVDERSVRDSQLPCVVPGFIDLHVHGGGGHDFMAGGAAAGAITHTHALHGTTSMLATTMTAPKADLEAAFADLAKYQAQTQRPAARILGVHLEGPYINQARLGAQPDNVRPANMDEIDRLHALVAIRLITLAPEVHDNAALIAGLVARGYKVQLGHTVGTYEQAVSALRCGATGFTHLFNAMPPMHHREPGMVGAALAHAEFAEIILDLLHVHPGAIHASLRAIPKLYCVTDATAAAGMPDGDYKLGSHTVHKCLGGVRLADGTLAGSALTMDQALRNLVNKLGLSIAQASDRVSTYAAERLGITDRGQLRPGAWADIVLLDRDLRVQQVYAEGKLVD